MKHFIILFSLFTLTIYAHAQDVEEEIEEEVVNEKATISAGDSIYLNWFNKDQESDDILGTSVDKAYTELLKGKSPKKTVIVAVIDGGVDVNHPDLEGKIWINEGEIPENGIDDDNNGYIDDIHGWNFLGNKKGENIDFENLEITRIAERKNINVRDYTKATEEYEAEVERRKIQRKATEENERKYLKFKKLIQDNLDVDPKTYDDVDSLTSNDQATAVAIVVFRTLFKLGLTDEMIMNDFQHTYSYLDYYLNQDFNPREIVGDDPLDFDDRDYGNPDVAGPRAVHGTGVSGVIAAVRGNDVGIDGIANSVKIMGLRAVPDGDERDKDVALAIIYAVDNGADIINMSFGKGYSPEKEFVDEAIKYAEANNVLLVHASGNDSEDIDENPSYPSDTYLDNNKATNFLSVGANNWKQGKELVATFSNYGQHDVDIFAPGVNMVTLDTSGTYSNVDGTSFAAPTVSGVAALVLSYYPNIKPAEMIDLLIESAYKVEKPKKVIRPVGKVKRSKKVKFVELSRSAGVVNAYNALKLAESKYK